MSKKADIRPWTYPNGQRAYGYADADRVHPHCKEGERE